MKTRTSQITSLALVFLLCASLLTGCGSSFDPQSFTKGSLDAIYHGEFSDEYMSVSGKSEAECRQEYEDGLEEESEYFAKYFDIDYSSCSDELKAKMLDLYRDIFAHAKYEIGNSAADGDMYIVSVTIYPIDIMQKVIDEDSEAFMEDYQNKAVDGKYASMSDDELNEFWAESMIELVSKRLDDISYLDAQTITVQLVSDGGDGYVISDEDAARIDELIVQYPSN